MTHRAPVRWNPEAIRAEHEKRARRERPIAEEADAERPGRARPDQPTAAPAAPPARTLDPFDSLVDTFIADRAAAGHPVPTRDQILDRIAHILGNVNLEAEGGTNSRKSNAAIFIVGKDAPPYFGVGTEEG